MMMFITNQVLAFWLAQTPTPVPSPVPLPTGNASAELELLRQQIDFLQTANEQLTSNFDYFASLLNTFFAGISIVITIVLFGAGLLGWQTLREIRNSVNMRVKQEVEERINRAVDASEDAIQRILQREGLLLDTVKVAYLVPGGSFNPTPELQLLKTRIANVILTTDVAGELLTSNVVVLDLKEKGWDREGATDQDLQIANDWVSRLLNQLPPWSVLVIYTPNSRSPIVGNLLSNRQNLAQEFLPANTKVTLLQAVESGAYVSHGLKTEEGRRKRED